MDKILKIYVANIILFLFEREVMPISTSKESYCYFIFLRGQMNDTLQGSLFLMGERGQINIAFQGRLFVFFLEVR